MSRQTVQNIVGAIESEQRGTRLLLLAPRVVHKKGEHKDVFESARAAGFVRVRVNGEVRPLDQPIELDKKFGGTTSKSWSTGCCWTMRRSGCG